MNAERVFYIIVAIMSIIGILMSTYYLGKQEGLKRGYELGKYDIPL